MGTLARLKDEAPAQRATVIPLRIKTGPEAGYDLDMIEAVELEVTCVVRLDRNRDDGLLMVLTHPQLERVRVRSVERRGTRLSLMSVCRNGRRRLRKLLRHLSIDAWIEPGR